MRRFLIAVSLALLVGLVVVCIPATALGPAAAGPASCLTKHCPPNTHCCYGCTGNPICVRNGAPCPECAPL